MFSRRKFFLSSAGGALGGLLLGNGVEARTVTQQHLPPARRVGGGRTPVITPNGASLPYRMENGVKIFHLTAEPLKREFVDGFTVNERVDGAFGVCLASGIDQRLQVTRTTSRVPAFALVIFQQLVDAVETRLRGRGRALRRFER